MILAKKIQNNYNNLYTCLREYIWPYNVICSIADLEISVYKTFPNLDEVKSNLAAVKACCNHIVDDELLNSAFEKFYDYIDSSEDLYAKLDTRMFGATS